jgi:RNA polymerase sigma factor (sigma-70 family)
MSSSATAAQDSSRDGLQEGVEDELARGAKEGGASEMRLLLEAVGPKMVAVVRAVLGPCAQNLDDAAQESLIALVDALPLFRGDASIVHYARRIALRTALRARRRERRLAPRAAELGAVQQECSGVDAHTASAAARRKEAIRQLLCELPAPQAEAFGLRVVLGYSLDEVATSTAAPVNTVRSRIRLAKKALRRKIEADESLAELLEVEL